MKYFQYKHETQLSINETKFQDDTLFTNKLGYELPDTG